MDFPSVSHIVVISCSLQPRLRETKSFVTKDFPSESSDWSPADVATVQSLAQYLLFSINPFPICINCIKCVWRQICDQSPGSHTVSVVDLQGSVNCSFNCRLVTTSWRQDASLVREREQHESMQYIMDNCCGYGCYPLELCPQCSWMGILATCLHSNTIYQHIRNSLKHANTHCSPDIRGKWENLSNLTWSLLKESKNILVSFKNIRDWLVLGSCFGTNLFSFESG